MLRVRRGVRMEIPREEAERFCWETRRKFDKNIKEPGRYDKADMLEDLTEWLKRFGVEVKGDD